MSVVLGANQYGKAEVHLVRITRDTPRHEITDVTVGVALSGDLAEVHLTGDNANCVATDSQKNTVFAFAREGVGEIEDFGLRLARHFVATYPTVETATITLVSDPWARIEAGGMGHDHAFYRSGGGRRTATVTCSGDAAWVVSGLTDLVVLKSTGSEFSGFIRDRYTTLAETDERILATAVTAQWRHVGTDADWGKSYAAARHLLLEAFATTHSLSLQQSLYAMGRAVLEDQLGIAEVRMSMPNKHHFLVDLSPFGLDNPNEVFYAADRPYGLIEGVVTRDDAPEAGLAWRSQPSF